MTNYQLKRNKEYKAKQATDALRSKNDNGFCVNSDVKNLKCWKIIIILGHTINKMYRLGRNKWGQCSFLA